MFQPGDLVIYGTTGVCRVESIDRPNLPGTDRNKEYYQLKPLYQDGIIYTPTENTKIVIRSVITRDEANALIDRIPTMQAEICHAATLHALAQKYQSAVRTCDCGDLAKLMLSIYAKQQQAEAQKRRLGLVDERYMKQAERLLYGELAAALDIPYDEVFSYITQRIASFAAREQSV